LSDLCEEFERCPLFLLLIEGKEEQVELEVFNFTGAGGVALSMYNIDEVQLVICCVMALLGTYHVLLL